jgi:hypothetical protein
VVKEVNTKDDIFGFKDGYPARFVKSPMWDTQSTDKKASKKIDTQKQNDQLLRLGPEKSRPEITYPKIVIDIYIWLWIGRAKCK